MSSSYAFSAQFPSAVDVVDVEPRPPSPPQPVVSAMGGPLVQQRNAAPIKDFSDWLPAELLSKMTEALMRLIEMIIRAIRRLIYAFLGRDVGSDGASDKAHEKSEIAAYDNHNTAANFVAANQKASDGAAEVRRDPEARSEPQKSDVAPHNPKVFEAQDVLKAQSADHQKLEADLSDLKAKVFEAQDQDEFVTEHLLRHVFNVLVAAGFTQAAVNPNDNEWILRDRMVQSVLQAILHHRVELLMQAEQALAEHRQHYPDVALSVLAAKVAQQEKHSEQDLAALRAAGLLRQGFALHKAIQLVFMRIIVDSATDSRAIQAAAARWPQLFAGIDNVSDLKAVRAWISATAQETAQDLRQAHVWLRMGAHDPQASMQELEGRLCALVANEQAPRQADKRLEALGHEQNMDEDDDWQQDERPR